MITTLPHPDWCEPTLCDAQVPALPAAEGMHRGALQRLVPCVQDGDAILVVAQLQQPAAIWFGDTDRKRGSLAQAADRHTNLAVQVGGGQVTLVPVDQARMLVQHIAPLLGLTVEASGGV